MRTRIGTVKRIGCRKWTSIHRQQISNTGKTVVGGIPHGGCGERCLARIDRAKVQRRRYHVTKCYRRQSIQHRHRRGTGISEQTCVNNNQRNRLWYSYVTAVKTEWIRQVRVETVVCAVVVDRRCRHCHTAAAVQGDRGVFTVGQRRLGVVDGDGKGTRVVDITRSVVGRVRDRGGAKIKERTGGMRAEHIRRNWCQRNGTVV